MSPGASRFDRSSPRRRADGPIWPIAVAIAFVALAATSFAVDQSLTLSSLPLPAATGTVR